MAVHIPGHVSLTTMYLIFVVGIAVVAAVGVWRLLATPDPAGWVQRTVGRFARIRDAASVELGRYLGALFVLIAGAGATFIVCWPFGRMARRYTANVDAPILRWTARHVMVHGTWHHLNAVYTHVGNHQFTTPAFGITAVVFALLWVKRGWWIPVLVVAAAYGFEKFEQGALAKVADRPKVPSVPDLGTYPSGGCARFIMLAGIVWFLICLTWPRLSRRVRITGYAVVAVAAFIEGYTRFFLLKHWMMDIIGGWLFGTMLLLVVIGSTYAIVDRPALSARDTRTPSAKVPTAV